jgi:hypothetical protein
MDGCEQVNYDATMDPHPLSTQTHPVAATDLGTTSDSLAELGMEFPAFRIWREVIGDRIQYVARRRNAHTHPHTVVTADPARLRSALSAGLTRSNHAPDDRAAHS